MVASGRGCSPKITNHRIPESDSMEPETEHGSFESDLRVQEDDTLETGLQRMPRRLVALTWRGQRNTLVGHRRSNLFEIRDHMK